MNNDLGPKQLILAMSLRKKLVQTGLFFRIGWFYDKDVAYIAAYPKWIFSDMVGKSKSELVNFAYTRPIPEEDNIQSDMTAIVKSDEYALEFLKTYIQGKRKAVHTNENTVQP